MSDPAVTHRQGLLENAVQLVSAYAANENTRLSPSELQELVRQTFKTLTELGAENGTEEPPRLARSKADIKRSIGPDALISFEDGKAYKSLKRHLTTRGLTPQDYKAKWGLPSDYPMVHPTYSAKRSALARSIGLGSATKSKSKTKQRATRRT